MTGSGTTASTQTTTGWPIAADRDRQSVRGDAKARREGPASHVHVDLPGGHIVTG